VGGGGTTTTTSGGTTTTTAGGTTTTTAGGTTTTTTTTTTLASTCYTASNYAHVSAGRAHFVMTTGHAAANGSNQDMGLYNTYYVTTLKMTGSNYYVIGSCP
jgi:poly(3-hydroxybutyrate) depolymerase